MSEQIVWKSANDVWTRQSVSALIGHVLREYGWSFEFEEVLNFVGPKPITLEDIAQYVVDGMNEDAPRGHWFTLTADCNVLLNIDEEVALDD